jgi:short-subunit dehydrogenase
MWSTVDVVINNAATLHSSDNLEDEISDVRSVMNLNFISPFEILVRLKPYLTKKGLFINILSPAIYRRRNSMWLYIASKTSLYIASNSLGESVPILNYFPGIISTNFVPDKGSIISRLVSRPPEYTAKKIYSFISSRRIGEYFEPVALIIKIAGILGF